MPRERDNPIGDGDWKAPSYERVAKTLTDRELREEIALGKGAAEYQQALRDECARRGISEEET